MTKVIPTMTAEEEARWEQALATDSMWVRGRAALPHGTPERAFQHDSAGVCPCDRCRMTRAEYYHRVRGGSE